MQYHPDHGVEVKDPRDHFWFLRHRADVLKCCGEVDNLAIVVNGTIMTAQCRKCGRVHRKMIADPIKLFGAVKALD